jgi:hypothetical protein
MLHVALHSTFQQDWLVAFWILSCYKLSVQLQCTFSTYTSNCYVATSDLAMLSHSSPLPMSLVR